MKWKNMSSPTLSLDSTSEAPTTNNPFDQGDLSERFNSSSSSSTCSITSSIFPHISISNGILSNGYSNGGSGHFSCNGDFNGLPSPTETASVKCGICHENFTRPKVLPCLHTFCQDCLEKAQDIGDRLVCPSCRQECPLGSQGVAGLLADYAVSNLLDGMAKQAAAGSGCNGGSSSDVTGRSGSNNDGGASSSCSNNSSGTNNNDNNNNASSSGSGGSGGHNGNNNNANSSGSDGSQPSCTSCKSNDNAAVAQCYDCNNYLCANCVKAHQVMHCFEGHRLSNIIDIEGGKEIIGNTIGLEKQVSCTQHKGEVLQFFCRTCAVPACAECVAMDHPKSHHECEVLSECESKYVKHLSQCIHDFRVKSLDLHEVLKSFEAASTRLHSQYVRAQSEVTEAFAFYQSLLDERKTELMKELETLYSSRQVTLSVVTQRVQETLDRMYQTVEFGDRLLRHASPPQILVFKKLLETRLQALLAAVPEPTLAMAAAASGDLEFVANYSAMQAAVRNTLGYIRSAVGPENPAPGKQPPAPIARPAPVLGNGYPGTQNGVSSVSSSFSNGVVDSLGVPKKQPTPPYDTHDHLGPLFPYGKPWSEGRDGLNGPTEFPPTHVDIFKSHVSNHVSADPLLEITQKLMAPLVFPKGPAIKRQKMIYHCKFGEFGTAEAQFTEPSGVAVNGNNEIIVADTNNHRIQIFDREGRFKFQFGECGKRDGQLLYPNRVAVVKPSGDIVVTERSPTHQIQIYNQYGQFVRKFGANILQHPRGVTVDNKGRVIVVECKVMRVIIFDQMGTVLHKFGCSKHLEFPNGVVVNDRQEIFISDNRAHCVKVFNYEGVFLRQIGGEGLTNYPIGVGINSNGEILVADNHNNFNLTIFTQDGQLVSALESKVKHAQCFDVALMDDGSVVLASKDYRLYIYRYIQVPPIGL